MALLAETPRHQGLLLAASRGFTQYAYAFIQEDADEMETRDFTAATELRMRAKRLYLRAGDYALRGLEVKYAGFGKAIRGNPQSTVAKTTRVSDVPLLYWAAASRCAAISVSKDDPGLIADQPIVEALIDQALRLDEKFENGSIHGFLINYEQARQGVQGDPAVRSKQHFERALELSEGKLASPLVSYAETVCVAKQNRAEFESLLKRALAVDPNARTHRRTPFGFLIRPPFLRADQGSPGSRARCFHACLGSMTPQSPSVSCHVDTSGVAFRTLLERRHSVSVLTRLDTMPALSSVNASRPILRTALHDSSPVWVAGPSPCGTFIRKQRAGLSRRTGEHP